MREIRIETNFNSKLNSELFMHISFAPIAPAIHESELQEPVKIIVLDGSHEPIICRVADLARCRLIELRTLDTWMSHGLMNNDFEEWWLQKYPQCDAGTEMGIYIYKKLTDQEINALPAERQKELFAA